MKSRSREVNIFNMSLLDILCGALGAFCFLTLVLFPSYKNAAAAGASTAALEEELKKTRAELERAREQISANATGDMKQMTQQLQQAENAWHEAESKLRQARSEAKKAQDESEKNAMRAQLAKTPMSITAMWTPVDAEVTMYVRFAEKQPDGTMAAPFNPNTRQNGSYAGENWFGWHGHEQWIIRDVPDGKYEIYYRVEKPGDARQPLQVSARYAIEGVIGSIPAITLDANRKGVFVGTLVRDKPKLEFRPAAGGQK